MLSGPKKAAAGPEIEPPPDKPGHRGQLARLIRERPVFVNRAAGHLRNASGCWIGLEYSRFAGVPGLGAD